jgi:hypothetical protein
VSNAMREDTCYQHDTRALSLTGFYFKNTPFLGNNVKVAIQGFKKHKAVQEWRSGGACEEDRPVDVE